MKRVAKDRESSVKILRNRSNVEPSDRVLRKSTIHKRTSQKRSRLDQSDDEVSFKVNFEKILLKDEYLLEYFHYLQKLETQFFPKVVPGLYRGEFSSRRSTIIDWMIKLHNFIHLKQETLFYSINLFDIILCKKSVRAEKLQLYAIAATWISIKHNEVRMVDATILSTIVNERFDKKTISQCEQKIISLIEYKLMMPSVVNFIFLYLEILDLESDENYEKLKCICFYLVDVFVSNSSYLSLAPSLLAAAAVFTGFLLVYDFTFKWPRGLKQVSLYSEKDIKPVAKKLLEETATVRTSLYQNAYLKYKEERYLKISLSTCVQPSSIDILLVNRFQ